MLVCFCQTDWATVVWIEMEPDKRLQNKGLVMKQERWATTHNMAAHPTTYSKHRITGNAMAPVSCQELLVSRSSGSNSQSCKCLLNTGKLYCPLTPPMVVQLRESCLTWMMWTATCLQSWCRSGDTVSAGRMSATTLGLSQVCFTTSEMSVVWPLELPHLDTWGLVLFKSASTDRSKILLVIHAAQKDQLAPSVEGTCSPAALHHFRLICCLE